jgi:hypothetical protein
MEIMKMSKRLISFRFDEEIIRTLDLKSKAVNMNRTEYITKAIIDSDIQVDNSRDIGRVIGSINKIGNNINQIAKNLNIARNENKLNEVDYNSILNSLIIIEHQLNNIAKNEI